jgi:hypothetical protein
LFHASDRIFAHVALEKGCHSRLRLKTFIADIGQPFADES